MSRSKPNITVLICCITISFFDYIAKRVKKYTLNQCPTLLEKQSKFSQYNMKCRGKHDNT